MVKGISILKMFTLQIERCIYFLKLNCYFWETVILLKVIKKMEIQRIEVI